jgi:hypothetical protein
MKSHKTVIQEFVKWKNITTGDVYYSYPDPIIKDIEGEKFFEVTADFKRAYLIKQDSVQKSGHITREWDV